MMNDDKNVAIAANEDTDQPTVHPPKETDYKSMAGAFKFGGVFCRVLSHFADPGGNECFKLRIIGKKQTKKRFVVGGEVVHGDFLTTCISTGAKGMEGTMKVVRMATDEEADSAKDQA